MGTTVLKGKGKLKIDYKGKIFKKPDCGWELEVTLPDTESAEEAKLLHAAYSKLWTPAFDASAAKVSADIKSAMDDTEKAILKKKGMDEDALDDFVDTANKLIQRRLDEWRTVDHQKLADACLAKVYDALDKQLKRKVKRGKAKAVLKVVGVAVVALVVAAASITASVASGGSATAVGLTATAAVLGALASSIKKIKTEYGDYKHYLEVIDKDIAEIDKAIAYQTKKERALQNRSLGPKEKAKLILAATGPLIKKLNKDIEGAEARLLVARGTNEEAKKQLVQLEAHFAKFPDQIEDKALKKQALDAKAEAFNARREVEKFDEATAKFKDLKAEAKLRIAELENKGDWMGGNVSKSVQFCMKHQDSLAFLIKSVGAIASSASKIKTGLGK